MNLIRNTQNITITQISSLTTVDTTREGARNLTRVNNHNLRKLRKRIKPPFIVVQNGKPRVFPRRQYSTTLTKDIRDIRPQKVTCAPSSGGFAELRVRKTRRAEIIDNHSQILTVWRPTYAPATLFISLKLICRFVEACELNL